MRNEKKIKVTTSSGKGTDDIYKPKWDLYPLLSFLKKTTAQAASVSNLDIDTDGVAISTNSEANENVNIASNIYFDENLQASLSQSFIINNKNNLSVTYNFLLEMGNDSKRHRNNRR